MEDYIHDPFWTFPNESYDFQLCQHSSVFPAIHGKVFALLLYKGVKIYLDDILIHSKTTVEHVNRVLSILQCLENTVLYCNAKKCEFNKKKIEFLGVNVSQDGFKWKIRRLPMSLIGNDPPLCKACMNSSVL